MIRKSITEEVTSKYVDKYLENSTKISYLDQIRNHKATAVLYKDLPQTIMEGYPVASDYVDNDGRCYSTQEWQYLSQEKQKQCSLRYTYMGNSHELYIGTTGSGKTTGCVEPQLRAISSQRNKPNIFLTDPKGELFQRNARHLANMGYDIKIINFKDITRSDRWNPLLELYDKKMQCCQLGRVEQREGYPHDVSIIQGNATDFDGQSYILYDNRAFPTMKAVMYYVDFQKDYMEAEIESMVNQFVNSIIQVQSKTDASWEYGAAQLLKGILLVMLEDAVDCDSDFTRDMMTLRTVQQYYLRLRTDLTKEDADYTVKTHPLLRDKSKRATTPLYVALNNAPRTMLSYCGVFDGATKDWFQAHIFALTTGCTIDIKPSDKPFAIFVTTRDYEKSDFLIAGLFVDWAYRKTLEIAEKQIVHTNGVPNVRPTHFLLDEFGNIPKIKDFENKISTSRSRNIWFHLFVQSYEQLDLVYGKETAVVVCDNCNAQIFLGAQSKNTKARFSEECGKHWIPSIESSFASDNKRMVEVPVVPLSDLDMMRDGDMYIKRLYTPVMISQYFRSYVCASNGDFRHFVDPTAYNQLTPLNMQSFNSPQYTFEKLDNTDYKFEW